MAIDGLIILDSANFRPIVQTSFRSFSTAYPLLHIDAYNAALAKAERPEDIDPVLFVPLPDAPTACCHLQHLSLIFLCPISGNLDPLYAFAFIRTFLDILIEYFGDVTAPTLRDNFDIVHQLLEETLDAGGHPLTTSPNALRDIVLPPSLITKILSVTGVSGLSGPTTTGLSAFSSPIPWRKAGLRYNNNEIYFDIIETLDAVVNKSAAIITSSVLGKINVNCKLSGTPDLLLTLTNPHTITEPSFHSCVRLSRFAQSKTLSFIPPDGRFTLMEYRFDPSASKPGAAPALTAAAASQLQVQVPFTLRSALFVTDHGGTFELTFSPRASALDDVVIELYLGAGASSATCSASTGGGGWTYLPAQNTLRWSLPPTTRGGRSTANNNNTLQGTFTSSEARPRPARAAQISFALPPGALLAARLDASSGGWSGKAGDATFVCFLRGGQRLGTMERMEARDFGITTSLSTE
ncbi:Mu homology domain-containing protein [Multifurca ochricompacta]|uniref:Mu homology domain-containing protein n=1 Tax=Multifurca ochricompacta TaxID=376703 RepID=A0AAD4M1D1_9AGAM|nr:Mu homology domain-containing protein [Multifurca ochricompacta]